MCVHYGCWLGWAQTHSPLPAHQVVGGFSRGTTFTRWPKVQQWLLPSFQSGHCPVITAAFMSSFMPITVFIPRDSACWPVSPKPAPPDTSSWEPGPVCLGQGPDPDTKSSEEATSQSWLSAMPCVGRRHHILPASSRRRGERLLLRLHHVHM